MSGILTLFSKPLVNLFLRFYLKTGLMFSKNSNIVTKLNSDNEPIYGYPGSTIVTRSVVGQPIGQLYGYVCEGMFVDKKTFIKWTIKYSLLQIYLQILIAITEIPKC